MQDRDVVTVEGEQNVVCSLSNVTLPMTLSDHPQPLVFMAALRRNGQAIMFYYLDLLFFRAPIFEAKERRPVGPFQDV